MFRRWMLQLFSRVVVVGNVVANGRPPFRHWRFVLLIVFLEFIHAALSLTKEGSRCVSTCRNLTSDSGVFTITACHLIHGRSISFASFLYLSICVNGI